MMPFSKVLVELIRVSRDVEGSRVWNSKTALVHSKPAIAPNDTRVQ